MRGKTFWSITCSNYTMFCLEL